MCTVKDGCKDTADLNTVTLDSNWRPVYVKGGNEKCYTDATGWDTTVCTNSTACAAGCALGGVGPNDWENTYGITASDDGKELKLKFITENSDTNDKNVGSRVFMLAPDDPS